MRAWLRLFLPMLVLLLAFGVGSGTAAAHPGHHHAAQRDTGASRDRIVLRASEAGRFPCSCPGCPCSGSGAVDCRIHCAADAALTQPLDRFLTPASPVFQPARLEGGVAWLPAAEPEPPRPIA